MILAIETSCDETSIAIVNEGKVLGISTLTQIKRHQKYGGVLPELASRIHLEAILPTLDEALTSACVSIDQIKAVAVTKGPGLIGCLHVGLQVAKTICLVKNIPLICVNHLIGHIYSGLIDNDYEYPFLSLLISGGHTELIRVEKEMEFTLLGQTLDDAVGEVFDKVARHLKLGYPGGPLIEKLAKEGKTLYPFPYPKTPAELDFSFSGLKTAVINIKNKYPQISQADIAYSFQTHVADILHKKTSLALSANPDIKMVVVAGGVSANSKIRQTLSTLNTKVIFPDLIYCQDNAAMIGIVGEILYKRGQFSSLEIGADSSWNIAD